MTEVRRVIIGWGGANDWEGEIRSLLGSWTYSIYLELGAGYRAHIYVKTHEL